MNIQDFTLKTYTPYAVPKPKLYGRISLIFGRPSSFGFIPIPGSGTPSDIYGEFTIAAITNIPGFQLRPNTSYNVTATGTGPDAVWLLELVNFSNPYPQLYLDQLTQLMALNSYGKSDVLSVEAPQSPDYFIRVPAPFYILSCINTEEDNVHGHAVNLSAFDLAGEVADKLKYGALLGSSEFSLATSPLISLDRSKLFDAGIYPIIPGASTFDFVVAELSQRE